MSSAEDFKDDKEAVGADPAEKTATDQPGGIGEKSSSTPGHLSSKPGSKTRAGSSVGSFGGNAKNWSSKNRKKLIYTGVAVTVISMLLFGVMGILAAFKLIFLKENTDRVRLARMAHILDSRSNRFVDTLIAAEVAGNENGKNRYFVANGWDNTHPITSFYEKMTGHPAGANARTNKFFDQLQKDKGYRFVRETAGPGSRDRLVRLEMNGQTINFADLERRGGLGNLDNLVAERFESSKSARVAWKSAVKDNTKFYQLIKRYNMRKWGYEKLGIRKWRFFEKTRENAEFKIRSRWTRAVGARSLDGSFLKCLTTPNGCPKSDSTNDAANKPNAIDPAIDRTVTEAEAEVRAETGGKKATGLLAKKNCE